jgi:NAD dependent epimerase/dehydratase family enzyme
VLKKLLLPFTRGLGGRVGSGLQGMSWISIVDVMQIIHKLISNNPESGPINLVAQQPISNLDFREHLGQSLHRPHFMPLPGFMVKLLFGEMGEALLLGSSRVTSHKLADLGIQLEYPTSCRVKKQAYYSVNQNSISQVSSRNSALCSLLAGTWYH